MAFNFKAALKNHIILVVLGIIGTGSIIYLTNQFGAGINPDSAYYISIARNVVNSSRFVGYDGNYVVLQPPLYPILLSIIKIIFHVDPLISSGYMNALFFGLIIYFSGLFLLKYLHTEALFFVGTISVLISYNLVEIFLMALSEPLFILLILLYIHSLEKYTSTNEMYSLISLSFFAALSCLTRYIGIAFIFSGIIGILFWSKGIKKERYLHTTIFTILSSLPICVWIIRNYILSGTFFGLRGESSYSIFDNISFYIQTIYPWFLPKNYKGYLFLALFLLLIILIFIETKFIKKVNKESTRVIGLILVFVLVYSVILITASTLKAYDPISDRFLSPIYIPIIFILFITFDKIIYWSGRYLNPIILTFIVIYCIITVFQYPYEETRNIIKQYFQSAGFQYGSQIWKDSKTIYFLKEQNLLKDRYKFYSNAPEVVNLLTDIETHWSPGRTMYNSQKILDSNSVFRNIWKSGDKVCLVWFNNINREFLLSLEELHNEVNMHNIAHLDDGEIFTFTKR